MDKMMKRFLNYISYDTKSDDDNTNCPSSEGQLVLGKLLVKELKELGIEDAHQDDDGYIYGSLKGNTEDVPTIGFISHMDTAPDLDGKCTNPQIIEYSGGDIKLNDEYSLTTKEFPFLNDLIGQKLITTDGTTLLGADDKAGISIIMSAVEYLLEHPEIKRGDIKIGFTPDEEIGRGADLFDVDKFDADFAYTIDGGPLGELEFENFNAASVDIKIRGKNVHPGSAKNIMVNSLNIAIELDQMLPVEQKPEFTEGYEGFYLLDEIKGNVDYTEMAYIIRDHSMEKFNQKKELIQKAVDFLNIKYDGAISMEIEDSYYNMREKIEPHMEIIELAKKSMEELDIEPVIKPIRGGTDGARLSYMGLPTPNIFTGGYNFHGRFEFVSYDAMEKAVKVLVKIVENNTK
ncbi:MAG: peptidase T [Tissierellia bacterium]|nr:peptidase T [Tissierellia bacterium]